MRSLVFVLLCLTFTGTTWAQLMSSDKMNPMDHGPFASTTISEDPLTPNGIIAYKGIAVKVGTPEAPATMVFDTDLLRVAQAWTGGFLHWYQARTSLQEFPSPDGFTHFSTSQGPGWTSNRRFHDARAWPYGPLPANQARYSGLYVHGNKVVFSYTVANSEILESFGYATSNDSPIFTRTFVVNPTEETLSLRVLHAPEGQATQLSRKALGSSMGMVRIQAGGFARVVGHRDLPETATWRLGDHHLILDLPPLPDGLHFDLSIGPISTEEDGAFMTSYLQNAPAIPDLKAMRQPGPTVWPPLLTQAKKGNEEGPFAVDELTLPHTNPWHSYLRLSGLDFLSDGRAVVSSLSGDVWLVSGIGESLRELGWKRFATGLNQPLGVRVVDDQVYVTGRDQITRFHDFNGDGEADFYENFNNEVMAATNFHAFTLNLETDAEGNFYFAKSTPWPPVHGGHGPYRAAEITPHHGVLFKLSPDGKNLEVAATGLRNPNGMGMSPDGEIMYSDNQGNWVPTSNVQRIEMGGFHGFVPSAQGVEIPDEPIEPIVWLPQSVDNSPGSPIWITSNSWPSALQGQMMLTSYGQANLSLLLTEEIDGIMQGGMLNLPLAFKSGTMRGRFHEDGHLYIVGLTSWQSMGPEDGSFHRVRYTGQSLYLPVAMNIEAGGIRLQFSDALDPAEATMRSNFQIEQWNYRWNDQYGSAAYSVNDPDRIGTDQVTIESVQLADDGKTVFLSIPTIQPVQNMSITFTLKAADGTPIEHTIYNTVNRVPAE